MFQATRRMLIAALLVASATLTTPAAYAMINEPHSPAMSTQESGTTLPQVRVVEASSSGFDWADAVIGAAVTVVLVGAGAATLGGRRRIATGHRHPARHASTR